MYPTSWGNFRKMAEHLPMVKSLMVDYIWVNPCFLSPWVDGGYDIADYMAIDPRFGSMEDFDFFVSEAKKLGIGILLDLVMNHTSTEHRWFKKSVENDPKYRDYYVWTDEDLGWGNNFDGRSAFEFNGEREKYYLHLFNKGQADLNWQNPDVLQEFQKIIDFWTLEHGVAGFRLDVAQYLGKNLTRTFLPRSIFSTVAGFLKYYQRPSTIEILHKLFDGRDLFVFSESGFVTKKMMREMAGENGPLSGALNVLVVEVPKRLGKAMRFSALKTGIKHWQSEKEFILSTENHDGPRCTSALYRDGEEILATMFNSDCEMICLYQGQELGLKNPRLSDYIGDYQDVQTIMRYEKMVVKGKDPSEALNSLKPMSRDNARQPINLIEYHKQGFLKDSCLNLTRKLIADWKAKG